MHTAADGDAVSKGQAAVQHIPAAGHGVVRERREVRIIPGVISELLGERRFRAVPASRHIGNAEGRQLRRDRHTGGRHKEACFSVGDPCDRNAVLARFVRISDAPFGADLLGKRGNCAQHDGFIRVNAERRETRRAVYRSVDAAVLHGGQRDRIGRAVACADLHGRRGHGKGTGTRAVRDRQIIQRTPRGRAVHRVGIGHVVNEVLVSPCFVFINICYVNPFVVSGFGHRFAVHRKGHGAFHRFIHGERVFLRSERGRNRHGFARHGEFVAVERGAVPVVVKRNGIACVRIVAGHGQAFQQELVKHGDPDRHVVAGLGFFVRFKLAAGRRGRGAVRCDRVDRNAEFGGNEDVRRGHEEGVFIIAPVCHGISRTGRIRHGDAPHRVTAVGVRIRRHLDGPSLLGKVEIRRDRAVIGLAVHDDAVLRLLRDPFKVGVNVQVAAADKDGINAVFRDLSHIRSDVQLTAVVAVNVHQAQGVRLIAVTVAGLNRQCDPFVVVYSDERFVRHYRAALHIVDENKVLVVAFAEGRRNQHVRGRHREGDRVRRGM